MRKWMLLVSVLALATACGGKDKKKTTASSEVPTTEVGGPDENSAETGTESDSSDGSDAADSANLQEVVYFEFDSSDLDDNARTRLEENAEWMKEDETRVLTIEGHTDEAGTTDYNLALGERRARTTRDYLVRLGVDEKRIQIITYGEERPAGGEDSLNRRSVFVATRK